MSGARISKVDVAAAHDGEAELVVTLTFANGGTSRVTLDEFATATLLASAKAGNTNELIGTGWDKVRDALIASSSRYTNEAA